MQGENSELLRDFAWRVNARAEKMGLSQTEIASRLGVTSPRVSNWFMARNFPRAREKVALAGLLGVRSEWLFRGEGDPEENKEIVSIDPALHEVRQIPVVSWSHAGSAATYEEIPKTWQVRVSTFISDKRAFAVEVEGDCMEPKFLPGDRVVLSPSNEARNGKPVVAKLADDGVQLRIYHKLQSGRIRLATLKPEIYPTEEYDVSAFHWIYPVMEMSRPI